MLWVASDVKRGLLRGGIILIPTILLTLIVRYASRYTLSRAIGQLDRSRNMADIQLIQCENQQKTFLNRRNIVHHKEIVVKESNDVRIVTGCL